MASDEPSPTSVDFRPVSCLAWAGYQSKCAAEVDSLGAGLVFLLDAGLSVPRWNCSKECPRLPALNPWQRANNAVAGSDFAHLGRHCCSGAGRGESESGLVNKNLEARSSSRCNHVQRRSPYGRGAELHLPFGLLRTGETVINESGEPNSRPRRPIRCTTPHRSIHFFEPQPQGLVYGKLLGNSRNTLKNDVVNMLEGCNLRLEDVKVDYNQAFTSMGMLTDRSGTILLPMMEKLFYSRNPSNCSSRRCRTIFVWL
ncbi:uncharacterized protein [Malus domestica]|uniref:uncharacterized protein n=1 Tax=Malus domestica TaxID=3750 RepID=UPI003976D2AF